jgi:hypothetical protein
MTTIHTARRRWVETLLVASLLLATATGARAGSDPAPAGPEPAPTPALAAAQAPAAAEPGPRLDISGFAMLDMGYQTGQNDPAWFDVVRPTKLPSFKGQFGEDGRWFAGVRQSRLGVKTWTPTGLGELYTIFEFEMFGVGVDAGQTTIRLRHAYGELGHFGAGQTWSPFMDIDVFPNSVEYWGPTGMAFFRNVQARWMPIKGDTRMTIALERPGASGDLGDFTQEIRDQGVAPRFPAPDLSAEYRFGRPRGYFEVAGIVRYMEWDDPTVDMVDLSGDAVGWGVNVSSNIKFPEIHANDVARIGVVYGEGVANYMNDATVDIGVEATGNPAAPFDGVPLPLLGVSAFYDHYWSDRWSTSAGYSLIDIDNSAGQSGDAFHRGQYALGNLLYYPVPNVMVGAEFQWGRRENKADGTIVGGNLIETLDDYRIQFSARYNFSHQLGGGD